MSPFIAEEGAFWLSSVLLGIAIAFVYDCMRVFRRVVVHGTVMISQEDLFYWVFVSSRFFFLLYPENEGTVRWFAIAGAFLGMLLFEKTAGPIFVRYVSAALLWIKGVATKAMRVFLIPFRRMKSAAGRRAASGKRCLKRGFRLAKKRLTVWGRVAKMVLCGRRKRRQRGE